MESFWNTTMPQLLATIWGTPWVGGTVIAFGALWITGILVALMKGTFTFVGLWDVLRPFTFAMLGGLCIEVIALVHGVPITIAEKTYAGIMVIVWAKVLANIAELAQGVTAPPAERPAVQPPSLLRTRQL